VLIHCFRNVFTAQLRSNEPGADPQRTPLAAPLLLLRDVTAYVTRSVAACVRAITYQRLFLCLHSSCFEHRRHNIIIVIIIMTLLYNYPLDRWVSTQINVLLLLLLLFMVTIIRGLDWMIGFIDTLYTQLVTAVNYSAIAISTLYSSLLHTIVSSVFTSRILATDS
jgi:hypothetical protein